MPQGIEIPTPLDLYGPDTNGHGEFIAYGTTANGEYYSTQPFEIVWTLRADWACAVLGVNMGELEGIADQMPECASWVDTSAEESGRRRLDSVDMIAIARARIAAITA